MYTRIQDAINASNNSDTIIVAAGIYNENVIVNKSINLTGAGANVTIINASDPNSHVIFVSAQNGVNISDFTATGGTGGQHTSRSAGIYLSRTNNTSLSNNIVSNNFYGIYLFSAISHLWKQLYELWVIIDYIVSRYCFLINSSSELHITNYYAVYFAYYFAMMVIRGRGILKYIVYENELHI